MHRQVEQRGGRERTDADAAVWGRNGFNLQALGGHTRHGHYAALLGADFDRPWPGDGPGACHTHMLDEHACYARMYMYMPSGPYGAHALYHKLA